MDFSPKQLQILKEDFAREKMQNASKQSRAKKPRIPHYEKADIASIISSSTTINKATKEALLRNIDQLEIVGRPYTYVFGHKTYISESEMKYYKDFPIYFE